MNFTAVSTRYCVPLASTARKQLLQSLQFMTAATMKSPSVNTITQPAWKFLREFKFPRSSQQERASMLTSILRRFTKRSPAWPKGAEWSLAGCLVAKRCSVFFCLTLLLLGIPAAHAQVNEWEGGPGAGSWFSEDWSLGSPPTAAQDAVVDNGSTAQIPLAGAVALTLSIGATTPGSAVQMTGGNLTIGGGGGILTIGPQGTLRFSGGFVVVGGIQNDGTVAFDGAIDHTLVDVVTGSGSLIMEGTNALTITSDNTYTGGTIISSGLLQLGNGGTTGSIVGDVLNNAVLIFNRSNTLVVPGAISGLGSVQQNGGGTSILLGNNTYTGGTFINAGTLQLGNGGTTGSIIGNVVNNGALIFNRSDTATFGGVISGPGNVQQNGSGTTVLTAGNTYTGGTIINAGTLQLGNGGTTGSIVGNVLNSGILAFNRSDLVSFGGLVSGTGVLAQLGSGTLALPNSNPYSGGTIISAGTILTQNASALGTGPVAFGNGATLQVQELLNVNGDWTVSSGTATVSGGVVQTFGDFNLGGGGTLIANANFNVPGAANINSSGFVVNSAFTVSDDINLNGSAAAVVNGLLTSPNVNVNSSSSLIVNNPGIVAANVNVGPSALLGLFGRINGSVVNAGFFQGTGVVNGNVLNSGIVSPGASIGTLTINGDYTQNASGTLRIEVAGASAGQYDVLAVNGRAFLAGTLQLVRVGNFRLQVGDRIAFLTATGGVNGTFSNIENDFLATDSIVVLDVVYLANSAVLAGTQVVVLEGTQGSFAEFASLFCGTPNAIAVGEALDSAVGDPRALELIDFLNNQALTDLCEDIDLISPEQLTSIFVVGVSLANVQTANLERRMTDIRAGSNGFSGGIAINGSAPSFWEGFAGVSGPEGKSGPAVFAPVPQNRWGVFATGLGEFTNVDSTFNASGFDLATGGFTMGVDYRIGSNFAVGLTGGYAYTSADLVNESNIGVNGGKLGVYATAFSSGFYLDTAVIGGLSGYDTRRTALEGTARGETLGGDLNVAVAGGYDWKKGGLTIGPTASFQYTLVGFDGFSESGSLAPLAFPSQHAESFRTAFGARASYDWKIGPAHIIPELRLAWQHEFGDTDYSLVSSFASGAGNSFTVSGPAIGRDSMLIGAGFAIHWNDRISTYAYYDGELFRTNYLSNNISAGFRLTF
jgi:autotransporter-associated beta strand protein